MQRSSKNVTGFQKRDILRILDVNPQQFERYLLTLGIRTIKNKSRNPARIQRSFSLEDIARINTQFPQDRRLSDETLELRTCGYALAETVRKPKREYLLRQINPLIYKYSAVKNMLELYREMGYLK